MCIVGGFGSQHAFLADAWEAGDVDIEGTEAGGLEVAVELHLWVAGRGMLFVL